MISYKNVLYESEILENIFSYKYRLYEETSLGSTNN